MTKKLSIVLSFVFFLCFSASNICAQTSMPDVTLMSIDGEKINIADYAQDGKITVFSFWATWCSPCKKELNNIAELYEEWQEEYDLEVVAVSIDDQRNAGKIKPYVNGQGWEYTVLLDPNEDLKRVFNFQTVPFTIVLNKKGEIAYQHTGYVEGDEYELEKHIQEMIEE